MNKQAKSEEDIINAIKQKLIEAVLATPHPLPVSLLEGLRLRLKLLPGFEGDWWLDLSNVEEPYLPALSKAVEEVKEVYCCPMLPQAYTGQQRHRGEGLA